MSNYYTILTRVGAALHANAQVNQTTVPWTHMRLGDGNGAPVTPTENQTSLVHQVHVLPITDIAVHPDNPNWVIAEAVVPSDVGGWTVRETAIYGGADGNTCIAVGNYPETYKPVLAEGAGREIVMRMVVQISSVATVKLLIDPAVAIVSRAWVESLVATPAKAGLVKLASLPEHLAGEVSGKAATPEGVQAMLDAHRWPFARITGTATLPASAFGIYALDATAAATVTLPSLAELPSDTELLLFAGHANAAAVQVKAVTGQAIQGPADLMDGGTAAFMLPAAGDWVRLRSEKAQGRWVVASYETKTRLLNLENLSRQTIIYPGGSESTPPLLAINTRIEIINPFPGFDVEMKVQYLYKGEWGDAPVLSYFSSGSTSHLGSGAVIFKKGGAYWLRSGANRLMSESGFDGNPWDSNALITTPLPFRVKVKTIGVL